MKKIFKKMKNTVVSTVVIGNMMYYNYTIEDWRNTI